MFLGPVEASKPWDTNGIDGVHNFIKKLWNLIFKGDEVRLTNRKATPDELKSLHKLIKKVTTDIENFSFNTTVAAFMICRNELQDLKCDAREVFETFIVLLAPFAPHVAEELWHVLGHEGTVCDAHWPTWNEDYLKESTIKYTVMIKGRPRYDIFVPAGTAAPEVEKTALAHEGAAKWLEGAAPKKVIVVPNKLVNIVL
jgi:leucyl-tRNA synthetase